MKKYTTIIFDLDGTLMDTLQDLANSVNYTLQTMHLQPRTIDEIRTFVGNGVRMLIIRALQVSLPKNQYSEALVEQALQIFRKHYTQHCKDNTKPYDGIYDLLRTLHSNGYKTAIVSNKPQNGVTILYEEYFSQYIDIAIGENEAKGIKKKPAPDMVIKAINLLHSNKSESIYIGDSDVDFETAKNAGLDCISVLWGFRSEEFLRHSGSTLFASSPSNIISIISDEDF